MLPVSTPGAPIRTVAAVGSSLMTKQEEQKKIDTSKPPILTSMEDTFEKEREQLRHSQNNRRQQLKESLKNRSSFGSLLPKSKLSNNSDMAHFKQKVTGY